MDDGSAATTSLARQARCTGHWPTPPRRQYGATYVIAVYCGYVAATVRPALLRNVRETDSHVLFLCKYVLVGWVWNRDSHGTKIHQPHIPQPYIEIITDCHHNSGDIIFGDAAIVSPCRHSDWGCGWLRSGGHYAIDHQYYPGSYHDLCLDLTKDCTCRKGGLAAGVLPCRASPAL